MLKGKVEFTLKTEKAALFKLCITGSLHFKLGYITLFGNKGRMNVGVTADESFILRRKINKI